MLAAFTDREPHKRIGDRALSQAKQKFIDRFIIAWDYLEATQAMKLEKLVQQPKFEKQLHALGCAKLAWHYLIINKPEKFSTYYAKVLTSQSPDKLIKVTLACISSMIAYQEGDYSKALSRLEPITLSTIPFEYQARVLITSGMILTKSGDLELAISKIEQANYLLSETDYSALKGNVLVMLAIAYKTSMDFSVATKMYTRAIDHYKSGEFRTLEYRARLNLLILHRKIGNLQKALHEYKTLNSYSIPHSAKVRFYNEFARLFLALEDKQKAKQYLTRLIKATSEKTPLRSRIISKEVESDFHCGNEQWDEALLTLDDGLELALTISEQNDLVGEILRRKARVLYELERDDDAFTTAKQALEICECVGEVYEIGALFRTLALLAARRHDLCEAENLFLKSIEFYRDRDEKFERARSHRELALFYQRIFHIRNNQECLQGGFKHAAFAYSLFDEMGNSARRREMQKLSDSFASRLPSRPFSPPAGSELVELGRKHGIITADPTMTQVLDILGTVAPSTTAILVTGETGTGKELIAKALHELSPRKGNALVIVNCAAIPGELMESELFGHLRGSFTGAHANRNGKFLQADGGTLFLDEIGDLSPGLQAKLLRVLQDGIFTPVGSEDPIHVDVRVISATNRNLNALMASGEFRRDLLYRLNHVVLHLPPLRSRGADAELLARFFLHEESQNLGRKIEFDNHALDKIKQYPWPGNVRELQNLIRRTALFAMKSGRLTPNHFPESFLQPIEGHGNDLATIILQTEKEAILNALSRSNGNKAAAARELGISRSTINEKIRRYNLTPDFYERVDMSSLEPHM
ncbi:MAG: AAA domain-containing protein [bacterium]|nr:AAA domain-containing protein [bacterium]